MVGREPRKGSGFQLQDSDWLRGVAGGQNRLFQSITAFAGGGQAAATVISPEAELVEIRTVATADDSVALPLAIAGMVKKVFNSSASSSNLYANPNTNRATSSTDTINGVANGTAYAIAAGVAVEFFCPRDGIWAAIKNF